MKDDDQTLVGVQSSEAPLEFVALVERPRVVGGVGHVDLGQLNFNAPASVLADLVVTGANEQPIQPGVEAVRIAQTRKVTPRAQECLLDCVFRAVRITENEPSRRIEATQAGSRENSEGVMIALLCPLNDISLHACLTDSCARRLSRCRV